MYDDILKVYLLLKEGIENDNYELVKEAYGFLEDVINSLDI